MLNFVVSAMRQKNSNPAWGPFNSQMENMFILKSVFTWCREYKVCMKSVLFHGKSKMNSVLIVFIAVELLSMYLEAYQFIDNLQTISIRQC